MGRKHGREKWGRGREGGRERSCPSCLAPPYLNCTVCFALAAGHGEKETLAEEEEEEEERKEQLQVVDVGLVVYLISLRRAFLKGCSFHDWN